MGDESTHNCILLTQEKNQVLKADFKIDGPYTTYNRLT